VYPPAPIVVGDWVLMGTVQGQLVAFQAADGVVRWHLDLGTGSIHGLATTGDEIVAVRGGPEAGVVALTHDAAGVLVDERSPTVVDPLRFLGNFLLAAVPLALVLWFLGRMLLRRLGPPVLSTPDEDLEEVDA
jgi:hypothetical protein